MNQTAIVLDISTDGDFGQQQLSAQIDELSGTGWQIVSTECRFYEGRATFYIFVVHP
jgi:hypothetical protein